MQDQRRTFPNWVNSGRAGIEETALINNKD